MFLFFITLDRWLLPIVKPFFLEENVVYSPVRVIKGLSIEIKYIGTYLAFGLGLDSSRRVAWKHQFRAWVYIFILG